MKKKNSREFHLKQIVENHTTQRLQQALERVIYEHDLKIFEKTPNIFIHKNSHFSKYATIYSFLTCGKLKAVLLSPIIAKESRIRLTWKMWKTRKRSDLRASNDNYWYDAE